MSRGNDNAPGPCVDERAAMADALNPDAIVSIHADGGPPGGHGFHVNYSNPPLNDAQSGLAVQLATMMRDQLVASGLTPSTYMGSNGLYGRADLKERQRRRPDGERQRQDGIRRCRSARHH
jgi:N-acetylmuramoyl-L-alanine amidase